MERLKKYVLKFLCLLFTIPLIAQKKEVVDYVKPTIGGVGLILEPTRPLVHLPNSMQYFLRIGAVVNIPEAKFNYAPAVRLAVD